MRPTTHSGAVRLMFGCALVLLSAAPAAEAMRRPPDVGIPVTTPASTPPAPAQTPPATPVVAKAPRFVFPVVGKVTFFGNDWGAPRPQGRHEGNDIGVATHSPVVAVAAGKVERHDWGGSGYAITLHAKTGDDFLYVHLGIDGRPGTAFLPNVRTGDQVAQGQQIGWSGYSGDAVKAAPHLHFEYHPGGKGAANPYKLLRAMPRLLYATPPGGAGLLSTSMLVLTVTGTVVAGSPTAPGAVPQVSVKVEGARLSNGAAASGDRKLVLSVPRSAAIQRNGRRVAPAALKPGDKVTVSSAPLGSTLAERLGRPGAISAELVQAVPAVKKPKA